MGVPPDENLPEVVTPPRPFEESRDSAPQAISDDEKSDSEWYRLEAERDKYHVVFDSTPKLVYEASQDATGTNLRSTGILNTNTPDTATTYNSASIPWESWAAGESNRNDVDEKPKICGLERKTFITILVVIIVIIAAAAIGGGVGGATARVRGQEKEQEQRTFLNNITTIFSGHAFQGFTERVYMGDATPIIQKPGFHDLGVQVWSYVWLSDGPDWCVTFCAANKTPPAVGWRCAQTFQNSSSAAFGRVYIWPGPPDATLKNETCS